MIGCGDNYNRALKTFLAKHLKKLTHFPSPLPHQRQHRHVSRCPARHHSDQRALSHTAPAEYADPLPSTTGQESVDRFDAAPKRFANRNSLKRQRRGAVNGYRMRGTIVSLTIQRIACWVDNAT